MLKEDDQAKTSKCKRKHVLAIFLRGCNLIPEEQSKSVHLAVQI